MYSPPLYKTRTKSVDEQAAVQQPIFGHVASPAKGASQADQRQNQLRVLRNHSHCLVEAGRLLRTRCAAVFRGCNMSTGVLVRVFLPSAHVLRATIMAAFLRYKWHEMYNGKGVWHVLVGRPGSCGTRCGAANSNEPQKLGPPP